MDVGLIVSLLFPIASEIIMKPDRNSSLKDCFGYTLVVIAVCKNNQILFMIIQLFQRARSLKDIDMELAMISAVKEKFYYSLYRFCDYTDGKKLKSTLRPKVEWYSHGNDIWSAK